MLRGNFGTSWLGGYEVLPEFLHRIPYTILLGSLSMFVACIIGIPLGIIAAIRQYHVVDYASLALALILFSLPSFWFAMMGQILFCLVLNWLPASGVGSLAHFVLPSITLGANILASQLRMTRTSMLDVVKQDYIRTARAKGAAERSIIWKHALKNALLPIITVAGMHFGALLGGSMITESVFAMSGVGTLAIEAIRSKDTPQVMASVLLLAVVFCFIMLAVDILYAFIDPRIRARYK